MLDVLNIHEGLLKELRVSRKYAGKYSSNYLFPIYDEKKRIQPTKKNSEIQPRYHKKYAW
jgi:hypothetical protein